MRKHDLICIAFLLLAIAGAAITFTVHPLTGQVLYLVAAMGLFFLPKIIGAPFQAWTGLLVAIGFGGVLGDWLYSPAFACAFMGVNMRVLILQKHVYSKVLWIDPLLSATGLVIYLLVNIFRADNWTDWALPAPYIGMAVLLIPILYADRSGVKKMLENGLIEIGTPAPDFSLSNFDGNKISLSEFKNTRDVLLIFVRGDWCPGCHIMLRLYERERKQFQDKNVMLIAIGPDPVGVNLAMVQKLGVEYAVLSDDTMEVSKKYCLQVQEGIGDFEYGVPLPASFLIDKQGIIRYTSRADTASEFLHPDVIFEVLAKI
jgi:peroxiredoxin